MSAYHIGLGLLKVSEPIQAVPLQNHFIGTFIVFFIEISFHYLHNYCQHKRQALTYEKTAVSLSWVNINLYIG